MNHPRPLSLLGSPAIALSLLVAPAGADSDEYSAFAFLEAAVVGLDQESKMTVHSPLPGAGVVLVAGLSPAAIDLGPTLPVLRVGPPYFAFVGAIGSSGTAQFPYRIGPGFPAGTPLYAQALVTTGSGFVAGSNSLQVFPDHVPATWSEGTGVLPARTSAFGGGDVDWADLDKNGYLDAFVANAGETAVPSLLMNSRSLIADQADARLPAAALNPATCVEIADVDNDGYPDLFLGLGPGATPLPNLLLRNDGTATFTVDATFPAGGGLCVDGEFGDVDGDEDLDLLVVSAVDPDFVFDTPDPATLYRQAGGAFVEDPAFSALPTNTPLSVDGDVSLGDVDQDGDLDVFVARSGALGNGEQNRLFENDGAGAFTDITADALPPSDDSSFEADFLDINQDGLLDLFVANSLAASPGISMLLNAGRPDMGKPVHFLDADSVILGSFPPSTNIRLACDVADVDGDGDLDIGVAVHHLFDGFGQPQGEAFLLLNQGGLQGNVTGFYRVDATFHTFGEAFVAGDLSFADVDNDGDVDCYVTSNGDLLQQKPPQDVLVINELN